MKEKSLKNTTMNGKTNGDYKTFLSNLAFVTFCESNAKILLTYALDSIKR